MRPEVENLLSKGRLPASDAEIARIAEWQDAVERIIPPLADEEARALVPLFPDREDDCYGLGWTLLHLVETAPGWPLLDCLRNEANPWMHRSMCRVLNASRQQEGQGGTS